MSVARSHWTDDDGSGTVGTIINESELQKIYDNIDSLLTSGQTVSGGWTFGTAATNFTSTARFGATGTPNCTVEIIGANAADGGLRFQSTSADANAKYGRIKVGHYTNSEEPVTVLIATSESGANNLYIGGGSSGENSLTKISFRTSSTATTVTGTDRMIIDGSGGIFINDTDCADITAGLVVNNLTGSGATIVGKSGDIAHGLTSVAETDSFFLVRKTFTNEGGALLASIAENAANATALRISSYGGQASTTKSTSGLGLLDFYVSQHSGSNTLSDITADGNVLSLRAQVGSSARTIMIVDEDGDLHLDGTSNATAWDSVEDAEMVRAFDLVVNPKSAIRSRWDEYVRYNRKDLVEAGILSDPKNGDDPLVCITQLQRLHNGAIWQLYTKIRDLELRLPPATPQPALVG